MKIVNEAVYFLAIKERICAEMANATQALNQIHSEVTHAFCAGELSEATAGKLYEEIHQRRKRQAAAAMHKLSPGSWLGGIPLAEDVLAVSGPTKRQEASQYSPEERARRDSRLRRRRYL